MRTPPTDDPQATAHAAATAAGVDMRELRSADDLAAAADLLDAVWGRAPASGHVLGAELLRALQHAGNQVSGAFLGEALVGATVAFLGRDAHGIHLHSHVTGVAGAARERGIGGALKQHQRAWALARGIDEVRWTFDPLVRRNAVFNLTKLGARAVAYLEDHYGAMVDARNAGLPTDRLLVSWRLTERRVVLAAAGRPAAPRVAALRAAGATVILEDSGGEPRTGPAAGPTLLAQVPPDIEQMRTSDRARAQRWAAAVRDSLGASLRGTDAHQDPGATSYHITGCTADGWYALSAGGVAELAG